MMELVLCIGSNRHRKLKPTQLSTLRTFCGTEHTSPKSNLTKEKKSSHRRSENTSRWRRSTSYLNSEDKGVEPLPLTGASMTSNATVHELLVKRLSQELYFSTTTAGSDMVCVSGQLRHVRKEGGRLADEKSHVRQKLECTHSNALRLGWPND